MQQYFARIVRAIVVSTLGFGGGIGLLTFIAIIVTTGRQDAIEIALKAGVVIGLGFGAMLAAVLLLSDLTSRLFMSKGNYKEIWDLEQSREIDLPGHLRDVRRFCREALLAVPNVKAVSDDSETEVLMKASIGASWKSPGEEMEIAITPAGNEKWHLKCTSRCLASNVAFDYAKNFENVEAWQSKLNRLFEEAKLIESRPQ
jgi:hypothetical protein